MFGQKGSNILYSSLPKLTRLDTTERWGGDYHFISTLCSSSPSLLPLASSSSSLHSILLKHQPPDRNLFSNFLKTQKSSIANTSNNDRDNYLLHQRRGTKKTANVRFRNHWLRSLQNNNGRNNFAGLHMRFVFLCSICLYITTNY